MTPDQAQILNDIRAAQTDIHDKVNRIDAVLEERCPLHAKNIDALIATTIELGRVQAVLKDRCGGATRKQQAGIWGALGTAFVALCVGVAKWLGL